MCASASKEKESKRYEFEIDRAIISDLIHSQNGTISTAIRELVMNSLDAESNEIEIRLSKSRFEVTDTGKGFPDEEYIQQYFRRFGTPHEEGDALYARFRIGRGQIMALGAITWHSNTYKMKTNIKELGYAYDFSDNTSDFRQGCRVSGELYNSLSEHEINHVKQELIRYLQYVPVRITFNGINITKNSEIRWDYEDEDIKVRWDPPGTRSIKLYNLGVYVKNIESIGYGIYADVVTNKALKLNMARNEISDGDPLWQKIVSILQKRSLAVNQAKASTSRLNDEARISLIRQFIDGNIDYVDFLNMKVFMDCRRRKGTFLWMFGDLPITLSASSKNKNSRIADRVATTNMARVFDENELSVWQADTLEGVLEVLWDKGIRLFENNQYGNDRWRRSRLKEALHILQDQIILPLADVAQGMSDEMNIVEYKDLTPKEKAARAALMYANTVLVKRLNQRQNVKLRKIQIGESVVANGWTDGQTYIAIEREELKLLDKGYRGAVEVVTLMTHEYCHDDSDMGAHAHDFEFYELYHDYTRLKGTEGAVGQAAKSMHDRYCNKLNDIYSPLPTDYVSQFTYPLINDVQVYTGYLKGVISPLAKLMLDGLHYKATKNKLTIKTNNKSIQDLGSRIRRNIKKQMAENGFVPNDAAYYKRKSGDWSRLDEQVKHDEIEKLRAWADEYGHDKKILNALFHDNEPRITMSVLIQLLQREENSTLGVVISDRLDPHRTVISKSVVLKTNIAQLLAYQRKERDYLEEHALLNESKEECFSHVLDQIKQTVMGITDVRARKEFCDRFLKDTVILNAD